jgi:hypothetical protein
MRKNESVKQKRKIKRTEETKKKRGNVNKIHKKSDTVFRKQMRK